MCDKIKTHVFNDPQHSSSVLERLYELMLRKKYCDVEIVVNGTKLYAHSNVLTACSQYFEIKINEIDGNVKQIVVNDSESDIVKSLVYFCYTGNIAITMDTVKSIASAANLFQINKVVEVCCDLWKKNLSVDNCLEILETVKFLCEDFHQTVLTFACYNLEEISKNFSFANIHFDTLVDLLKFDLSDISEAGILSCVKKWLSFDLQKRSNYLHLIFEYVKLPLLPAESFFEAKSLCKFESKCEKLMTEALQWQLLTSKQNELKSFRTRPRKHSNTLLVLGSWDLTVSTQIEVYNPIKKEWFKYSDVDFRRRHFKTINFEDKLIIIGGYDNNKMTDMVESLNLENGSRTAMASLNKTRGFVAATVLGNAIYVAGGHDQNGVSNLVEKWSKETERWTYVTPMNFARDGCHAAVLNEEMYVVGGWATNPSSVTEAYSPITGKWRQCASMNIARMYPGLVASNGFLYIVGGRSQNNHVTEKYSSVERYDPVIDKWTFLAGISAPRYGMMAGDLNGEIYTLGGADGTKVFKDVEIYDPVTNVWLKGPMMNYGRETPSVVNVAWKLVKNAVCQ